MGSTTAKPQAAFGAGALAAIISQAVFATWPALIGQTWVETAITSILTLAAAAFGAWQARNTMTASQVRTAITEGDMTKATVAAVAQTTPAPTPDGHSSTMKPIPR